VSRREGKVNAIDDLNKLGVFALLCFLVERSDLNFVDCYFNSWKVICICVFLRVGIRFKKLNRIEPNSKLEFIQKPKIELKNTQIKKLKYKNTFCWTNFFKFGLNLDFNFEFGSIRFSFLNRIPTLDFLTSWIYQFIANIHVLLAL